MEEPDGHRAVERRHGDDHARLKPGRPSGGRRSRRTIKAVYEDPRTGFGSIAQTLRQAQVRDPSMSREEVKAFLDTSFTGERGL